MTFAEWMGRVAKDTMGKDRTEYCNGCDARCCRYFTVPLERPEDEHDFDALYWYMLHEGVSIYVDAEGDWFVNVDSRCRALGEDGMCTVYSRRPDICREHNDEICEKGDEEYGFREHFLTVEALKDYAARALARRDEVQRRRSEAARLAWRRRKASGGAADEVGGPAGRPNAGPEGKRRSL